MTMGERSSNVGKEVWEGGKWRRKLLRMAEGSGGGTGDAVGSGRVKEFSVDFGGVFPLGVRSQKVLGSISLFAFRFPLP